MTDIFILLFNRALGMGRSVPMEILGKDGRSHQVTVYSWHWREAQRNLSRAGGANFELDRSIRQRYRSIGIAENLHLIPIMSDAAIFLLARLSGFPLSRE